MSHAVEKVPLPQSSGLHEIVGHGDFLDCYSTLSEAGAREAAEIAMTFPGWVRSLMAMRNALVAPFGLTTEEPLEVDRIGLFPLVSECDNEVIAGFDDKHLNFRVAMLADSGRVYLATWVHPHNLGGRLYLAAVMPFHVVIVRDALKRVAGSV